MNTQKPQQLISSDFHEYTKQKGYAKSQKEDGEKPTLNNMAGGVYYIPSEALPLMYELIAKDLIRNVPHCLSENAAKEHRFFSDIDGKSTSTLTLSHYKEIALCAVRAMKHFIPEGEFELALFRSSCVALSDDSSSLRSSSIHKFGIHLVFFDVGGPFFPFLLVIQKFIEQLNEALRTDALSCIVAPRGARDIVDFQVMQMEGDCHLRMPYNSKCSKCNTCGGAREDIVALRRSLETTTNEDSKRNLIRSINNLFPIIQNCKGCFGGKVIHPEKKYKLLMVLDQSGSVKVAETNRLRRSLKELLYRSSLCVPMPLREDFQIHMNDKPPEQFIQDEETLEWKLEGARSISSSSSSLPYGCNMVHQFHVDSPVHEKLQSYLRSLREDGKWSTLSIVPGGIMWQRTNSRDYQWISVSVSGGLSERECLIHDRCHTSSKIRFVIQADGYVFQRCWSKKPVDEERTSLPGDNGPLQVRDGKYKFRLTRLDESLLQELFDKKFDNQIDVPSTPTFSLSQVSSSSAIEERPEKRMRVDEEGNYEEMEYDDSNQPTFGAIEDPDTYQDERDRRRRVQKRMREIGAANCLRPLHIDDPNEADAPPIPMSDYVPYDKRTGEISFPHKRCETNSRAQNLAANIRLAYDINRLEKTFKSREALKLGACPFQASGTISTRPIDYANEVVKETLYISTSDWYGCDPLYVPHKSYSDFYSGVVKNLSSAFCQDPKTGGVTTHARLEKRANNLPEAQYDYSWNKAPIRSHIWNTLFDKKRNEIKTVEYATSPSRFILDQYWQHPLLVHPSDFPGPKYVLNRPKSIRTGFRYERIVKAEEEALRKNEPLPIFEEPKEAIIEIPKPPVDPEHQRKQKELESQSKSKTFKFDSFLERRNFEQEIIIQKRTKREKDEETTKKNDWQKWFEEQRDRKGLFSEENMSAYETILNENCPDDLRSWMRINTSILTKTANNEEEIENIEYEDQAQEKREKDALLQRRNATRFRRSQQQQS